MSPIIWIFGRPSSGKSTLAVSVKAALDARGVACCILDGDNTREWLTPDCGWVPQDRFKKIQRSLRVAKLLASNGIVVICAYVTPTWRAQNMLSRSTDVRMVYLDVPLWLCCARDSKGLYAMETAGILDFDGPIAPALMLSPAPVAEWTNTVIGSIGL